MSPRDDDELVELERELDGGEESAAEQAERYEAVLRAIAGSTLEGEAFADWVQAACADALDGLWPECPQCGGRVQQCSCLGEAGR